MMFSPLQILCAKVVIALVVGTALGALRQEYLRHGTLWPAESGQRTSIIVAVLAILLALPAYVSVSQFNK